MDINLTVTKHEYANREMATRLGHAYSVSNDKGVTLNNNGEISQFDAIDQALNKVLKRASQGYYEADITITGATTLSDGLKTFLVDKYEVEAQISSITFA